MDLHIRWQSLIRERANYRQGTQARSELDNIYFNTMPTIVAITKSVSDQEMGELVKLAGNQLNQLKQREGA